MVRLFFNDRKILDVPTPSNWPSDALGIESRFTLVVLHHERHFRYADEPLFIDSIFGKDGRVYRWKLTKTGVEILRFDRDGHPAPFKSTGTNGLAVDPSMRVGYWHDVYFGHGCRCGREHLLRRQAGRYFKEMPGERVRRPPAAR